MDKLERALEKARKVRSAHLGTASFARPAEKINGNGNGAFSGVVLPSPSNVVTIKDEYLEKYHVLAHHARSKEADVFRILRTQILQIMDNAGFKTLAVTSPNYGDGKTTIALNLAVSIALDLNQTVLLADLDLRKPGVTAYLGIESAYGLTDYLAEDRPMQECLLRTSFERLSLLPAGKAIDHSSETLRSPKMAQLASEMKQRYHDRLIIYDMPPILAQDDPIAFLPHIDAVLVIAREGVTRAEDIKRTMQALSGANVIGTVLNNSGSKNKYGKLGALFNKWLEKV